MELLQSELERRKYLIVNFLYSFFVIVSAFAVIYQVVYIFKNPDLSIGITRVAATLGILLLFLFCRFFLIKKNLLISTYLLIILLLSYTIFASYTAGTAQAASYIVLGIIIVISAIVISVKSSFFLLLFFSISTFVISWLHNASIVSYSPDLTTSNLSSTIMFLLLSFILFVVTYIGFREIGHSYDKAFEYAKELERLNENLEEEVAKKTEKIKEAYAVQSDVMHKQAVLGHITQALLHDIATPMSVILGNVKLLKKKLVENEELELLESSVLQIDSLIENSRNLIKRNGNVEMFNLQNAFNNALVVFEKRASKANIKISVDISENLVLNGISSLFIRFVSNILINAIEELENTDKKNKKIEILAKEEEEKIIIQIKDNGNGIPADMVSQIFTPDFSSKDDMHLGFGLSFVKDIVERRFGGTVEVDTIFGKYTNFVITLPKEFEYEEV